VGSLSTRSFLNLVILPSRIVLHLLAQAARLSRFNRVNCLRALLFDRLQVTLLLLDCLLQRVKSASLLGLNSAVYLEHFDFFRRNGRAMGKCLPFIKRVPKSLVLVSSGLPVLHCPASHVLLVRYGCSDEADL